jgi:ankyrin repeat protein
LTKIKGEAMFAWLKSFLFGDPRAKAGREGDIKKMKELLDSGMDINKSTPASDPALFHAAAANQCAMVKFLLENGAHIDGFTNHFRLTPLMMAASFGHEEMIALLIENGADVNARDINGNTPLDKALEPTLAKDNRTLTPEEKEGAAALIRAAGGLSGRVA